MIAGLDLTGQRQRHRGHAGCGRPRGLGAFERRHARLEHGDRRIGEARILETRLFVLEAAFGLGGVVVDVALGQKQRFGSLAEWRAQRAGMNKTGFGTITIMRRRGHLALLIGQKQNPAGRNNPQAGLTRPRPFSKLFYVACKPAGSNDHGIKRLIRCARLSVKPGIGLDRCSSNFAAACGETTW